MAQLYKPCLLQKMYVNAPIKDSMEWGIYIKRLPFKLYPEMKDLPSRDWLDENGDDEFVPNSPVYKAYEIECEFVFIGSHGTANTQIKSFLNYQAVGGKFKLYDILALNDSAEAFVD